MEIVELTAERSALVRRILQGLPEWFGRPDSLEAYAREADQLPTLVALVEGEAVGFLCLKRHSDAAAEAYVLGVERSWHRRGCGRALFEAAERRLAAEGARFLTVKTVAADDGDDPYYAATRRFYEAIGFAALEVFPTLWDEETPCLFMAKSLAI